jgi:uncharacterized protein (DUF934 family)
MPSSIALYYPHTEFHDANWLKSALLYWEGGVRRIVPDGYKPTDNAEIREASAFIKDTSPSDYLGKTTEVFIDRLASVLNDIDQRKLIPDNFRVDDADFYGAENPEDARGLVLRSVMRRRGPFDESLDGLHFNKLALSLRADLVERGLAMLDGNQLVMNQALVAMYMTMLADSMSKGIDNPIISDRPDYAAVGRRVAYGNVMHDDQEKEAVQPDRLQVLRDLKIEFPSPADLAGISMAKLLRFREERKDEIRLFRAAVDAKIAVLATITDAESYEQRVGELKEDVSKTFKDFKRTLREANIQTTQSALSIAVPTTIAAAITSVGSIALSLNGIPGDLSNLLAPLGISIAGTFIWNKRNELRREAATKNPEQYLLNLARFVKSNS